jgi:hypothetical protein
MGKAASGNMGKGLCEKKRQMEGRQEKERGSFEKKCCVAKLGWKYWRQRRRLAIGVCRRRQNESWVGARRWVKKWGKGL